MSPYYAPARQQLYDAPAEVYDLLSVIVHEGQINSGHYTNFTRRDDSVRDARSTRLTAQWVHYNDETVTPTSLSTVLKAQAYLLLYARSA